MAAYPDIKVSSKSTIKPRAGIKLDVSTAGTIRGINMYNNEVADFTIIHELISEADKDALLSFYNSNKTVEFTYIHPESDGTTWYCFFKNRPQITWRSNGKYDVISSFLGKS